MVLVSSISIGIASRCGPSVYVVADGFGSRGNDRGKRWLRRRRERESKRARTPERARARKRERERERERTRETERKREREQERERKIERMEDLVLHPKNKCVYFQIQNRCIKGKDIHGQCKAPRPPTSAVTSQSVTS